MLTAATAFKVLLALLQLAKGIGSWIERRGLLNEGRKLQIADGLAEVARSSRSAELTRNRMEDMTDEELWEDFSNTGPGPKSG